MGPNRGVPAILLALVLVTGFDPARHARADEVSPLELVSDSAAICLEIPRLEQTWSRFKSSRLLARLKAFPPVERLLKGPGFQKWTNVQDHVRGTTGKPLSEHLLGAFSESLVVAVYLPEGQRPEGVVIAQARDAAALTDTLQAWAKLEPNHDSQAKEHLGQAYVRRAKSANSTEIVFYTTFGRMIALSDRENLIRQVIEFHAARQAPARPGTPRMLSDAELYRINRARLPGDAAAFFYLNPRRWDQVVDSAVGQSADAAWIQPVFRRVSAVAAALRLDDEVVLDLVADTRGTPLPDSFRQFVAGTAGGGDLAHRIPDLAILALSSRTQSRALIETWLALAPEARTEDFAKGRNLLKSLLVGRDFFTEILPQLLSDWTIAVVPADAAGDDPPVHVIGQFSLGADQAADQGTRISTSVDHALQFTITAAAAALSHQRGAASATPVLVKTTSTAAGTVRSLGGAPPWNPAYLVTPEVLTVATSPRAVEGIRVPATPSPSARLLACEQRYFPSATQLVWLDAERLRTVLARRGDALARQLASNVAEARQRIQKYLSKVEETARVFDAAFLAAGFDDDHLRIVLGVALDRSRGE